MKFVDVSERLLYYKSCSVDGQVLRIVLDVEEEEGFVTVTPITAYEPTELEP
jgi:hypothetical protein